MLFRSSATPAGRDVPIELSASIGALLGPLAIAVERMGVAAKVSLPDGVALLRSMRELAQEMETVGRRRTAPRA